MNPDALSERRRPARTPGRVLSFGGGALLACCFVLPAVDSCGGPPTYPYEVAVLGEPYLIGLLAAAAALALLVRATGAARVAAIALGVAVAASLLALGVALHAGILYSEGPAIGLMIAASAAWWVAARLFWPALRRQRPPPWRIARATWVSGLLCTVWFGLWMSSEDSLYGIYLSAAASLALVIGGALSEYELSRPLPPPPPPELPRAVARYP